MKHNLAVPWFAEASAHPRRDDLQGYKIIDSDGSVVAEMFPESYRVHVNAYYASLLAAAPDLLAACEAAATCLDEDQPITKDRHGTRLATAAAQVAVEMVRAAIAKAAQPPHEPKGRQT